MASERPPHSVLSTACVSAASNRTLLDLKAEGKSLAVGCEVLLVAGYSLGPCYWAEQDFKVAVNRSKADKLVRTGEAGQIENCGAGKLDKAKSARSPACAKTRDARSALRWGTWRATFAVRAHHTWHDSQR